MSETIKGWAIPVDQFRRDLITLATEGADINVKGVVSINGDMISFSSGVDYPYNVFMFRTKVYRLVSMTRTAPAFYKYVCNIDVLSSIYQNGGTIKLQTQRIHLPLRCIRREWGGEESVSTDVVCDFNSGSSAYYTVFVCFVSTHNKVKNTNGGYVRYIFPVDIKRNAPDSGWLSDNYVIEYREISPGVSTPSVVYPSLIQAITDLDAITGIDGASVLDVSYSTISPFKFNTSNHCFQRYNSVDAEPNCSNVVGNLTYKWYQLDDASEYFPGFGLESVSYTHTVPRDTLFGYIAQDMSLIVEGRKCMDLIAKNDNVVVNIVPFYGFTGVGYIISQGDNSTTVMGSKLPWVSDAWVSYCIQKKSTDETKMWYDTVKSVLSLGVGVGGMGLSGGATAMSVPSSAVGLIDPYMSQKFTEEYTQKIPYGAGSPYGDIGSLYYLVTNLKYPIYVVITKYKGQPELPTETGKVIGYPATGRDDIIPGGYFMGEIYSMSAHWCLSQNEMDILISSLRRGIKT